MAEPVTQNASPPAEEAPAGFQPYVPDKVQMPEFTWPAVIVGAVLGIIFGASSLYLLLKVGMTVSASVPIAVLSITLFRVFTKAFSFRRATIIEWQTPPQKRDVPYDRPWFWSRQKEITKYAASRFASAAG